MAIESPRRDHKILDAKNLRWLDEQAHIEAITQAAFELGINVETLEEGTEFTFKNPYGNHESVVNPGITLIILPSLSEKAANTFWTRVRQIKSTPKPTVH